MSESYDEQEKQIALILEKGNTEIDLAVSKKTLEKYYKYLKKNIEYPCLLTGIEDFPWEERYVFGYGEKSEYEELKKSRASYRDIFELIGFEENEGYQIIVKVRRKSDKKEFSIGLDWLEAVDKDSKNYRLLHDYVVWYVNYQ